MSKNKAPKQKSNSLEERFLFLGDGISLAGQTALKSALFEVEERSSGISRKLKLWRKTGTPIDEDLRRLWIHEMRQVQRIMGYVGSRDVIVDVVEFVEDFEYFGVLLECAGAPLSARKQGVNRYHWLQNLSASRPRVLLWRNIQRMASALGIIHSQGLVHGGLSSDAVMTEGADQPDFQLSGFEWSLWVKADTLDKSHAAVSSVATTQRPETYSFAEDWRALGALIAECLEVKLHTSGDIVSSGSVNTPIILSVSERTLLKRLLKPTRRDYLESASVVRSIEDIIAGVSQSTVAQSGTLVLGFSPSAALGAAIYDASAGAIAIDEFRKQLSWIQADLETGATLVVPRSFTPQSGTLRLLTENMVYRLRPYRSEGAAQWDIAVCFEIERRTDSLKFGQYTDHALIQTITAVSIPREAENTRNRLGPAAVDWSAFAEPEVQDETRADVKMKRGLLLTQIVESVVKALETYPVQILEQRRDRGRRYAVVRAEPNNERDKFAKKVGLTETAIALGRLFEEDAREADGTWCISQSASLGASQRNDVSATFVDEAEVQGLHGYLFELDQELPSDGPYFLRAERDVGTERVISRRLANIKALDTRLDLAEMLEDPWRVRRASRESINESDQADIKFQELDRSKKNALVNIWGTLPSFFVVGPPGVGKTKLATEVVRRRFAAERATRMLVSAQGHDALDHLQKEITDVLRNESLGDIIVVRSTTPDRRKSSDEEIHLLGLEYLAELDASALSTAAPAGLRERVKALRSAAERMPTARDRVSREERSGLHAVASLILDAANIVISTSNSPDVERLVEAREQFDWVIIEEAAKATGPEMIGALMLSGRRLLIGDHNQLSPFGAEKISKVLKDHSLITSALGLAEQLVGPLLRESELDELAKIAASEESLTEAARTGVRLLELFQSTVLSDEQKQRDNPAHRAIAATLTEQRRMDPAIARIISHAFYEDKLDTFEARKLKAELEKPPFVNLNPLPESPVVVVDFKHVSASGIGKGVEHGRPRWHNFAEIDAVIDVLKHIRARPITANKKPTLAILSPYQAQVEKLESKIQSLLPNALLHLFDFAPVRTSGSFVGTVDSFQGSEADLVILSLVRNNPNAGFSALGFLRDPRRMNVAISRAKSQLVIVGSLQFLREAVRGVNPDQEKHDLQFLTRMLNVIEDLTKEKREKSDVRLATIISPQVLRAVP